MMPHSGSPQAPSNFHEGAWTKFDHTTAGTALGLRTVGRQAHECLMAIDPAGQTIEKGTDRIHPGAMVVLADQCLGSAASGERPRHLVTLDLRLDWFGPAYDQSPIFCLARTAGSLGRAIYVTGDLTQGEGGPLIAKASGQFLMGASAGGFAGKNPAPQIIAENLGWASFEDFLGLQGETAAYVLPAATHRIGSVFLPAVHGGITAATLQQAMILEAQARRPGENLSLLSSTTQFLNAGAAREPLMVKTAWVRTGHSVLMASATAYQARQPEPVGVSQATFIVSPRPIS